MAASPTFVGTPKIGLVKIVNADASAQKTLYSAGANGSKITSIMFTSTDSVNRVIQISVKRSSVNYILGSVTVVANAGTDGATPSQMGFDFSLLRGLPVDNDGQPYILLQNGDEVDISSTTTVTTGSHEIDAEAIGADF